MATRSTDHEAGEGSQLDAVERDAQSKSESMSSLTEATLSPQRRDIPASESASDSESDSEPMTGLRDYYAAPDPDAEDYSEAVQQPHDLRKRPERLEAMETCPAAAALQDGRATPAPAAPAQHTHKGEIPDVRVEPLFEQGSHMQWRFAPYHTDEQIANAKEAFKAMMVAFDASQGNCGQPLQPTEVAGSPVAHAALAQRPNTVVVLLEPSQPQPQPPAAAGDAAPVTHGEARCEQPQPPAATGSAPPTYSQVHFEQPQPPAAPGSAPGAYSQIPDERPQPPAAPGSVSGAFREVQHEQPQPPAAPGSAPHTPPSRGTGRRPADPIIIDGSPAAPTAARRPQTPGPARRPTTLPQRSRLAGRAPTPHTNAGRPRRYPRVVNIVNVNRHTPASQQSTPNLATGGPDLSPTDQRSVRTSSPLGMADDLSQYGSGSWSSGSVRSGCSSLTSSMPVPLFDGHDWPGFMSKFRACARHYGWTDRVKARRLHTSIIGEAREALGLATGATWSYYQLKKHMDNRYGYRNAIFSKLQSELFARRRKPGQSLSDFYEELLTAANKARIDNPMRDNLVYTAFIYGLYPDSHMYRWVARRERVGTVESAISLAAAYEHEFGGPVWRQPPMVTVNARHVQQSSKLGRYSPSSSPRVMPAAGDGQSLCTQMADGFKKLETHVSTKVAGLDRRLLNVEAVQHEHVRRLREREARWRQATQHSGSSRPSAYHGSNADRDSNWRRSGAWNFRKTHTDGERFHRNRRDAGSAE